jgi:hypothetical protein
MRILFIALVLSLAACAGRPPAGHVRFHNSPPATVVNDRRDVAKEPVARKYHRRLIRYDGHFHRRLTRWMEMPPVRRAANVSSIDEVPDSTWFTNRIGVRDLSVGEMRRGPNLSGNPEMHRPWLIKSTKVGGMAVGFIVEDKRGNKYILKFDDPLYPEAQSATDVVAQRLLWAVGYNVPEDYVVYLKRDDLVIAKDAVVEDVMGRKEPLTEEFLRLQLAKVHTGKNGTIRGLVSKYLDGTPIGGHPTEGVREDDPNDRVPHQLRRELRGAYTIFAWLGHTDIKEDNFLDMYVADPEQPRVHYVMHYLVDFGKALGVQAFDNRNRAMGRAYTLDFRDMSLSLLSLGLWKRPWEGMKLPEDITGVGAFESQKFHPGKWKPNTPGYYPLLDADRFDGFWGAKIVIRFTPAQIRAAVEQGRYSDPRAVDYVTRTLIERQRKTARYWFARVAPLDRFTVRSTGPEQRLCFEDLALRYRLSRSRPTQTRYAARAYDGEGRRLAWAGASTGTRDGQVCLPSLAAGPGRDGYTIVRIETSRPDQRLPAILVHLARDPKGGGLRVIGLRRL